MQVDSDTWQRYQTTAPEIAADVTEEFGIRVMKRDPNTATCVRFDHGLCSIQRARGTDYLGDACHFFPRITRTLGQHTLMTAALSCPETTRLALFGDTMASPQTSLRSSDLAARLPSTLKDYLPEGMSADGALAIHQQFLALSHAHERSAERTLSIISSVTRSLSMIDTTMWVTATPFYINNAEARLPKAEQHPEDPFNLLHAFVGLVDASPAKGKPRLEATISEIERALAVSLNRKHGAITTTEQSLDALLMMEHQWRTTWQDKLQPILQRWLSMQIATTLYPFAGFGDTITDVLTLLGMRFALMKLAFMSYCSVHQHLPSQDDTIRIVQGQARFLEHLASPELSQRICQETGWHREPRLRALIGDM
jgi:hypothetical protein